METTEKSIEILNDLIHINNDRIAAYEYAWKALEDNDTYLKSLFQTFREESRQYVHELNNAISQAGGEAEDTVASGGTIHRAWLDFKALFVGTNRKNILEECENSEDAVIRAYRHALDFDSFSPELIGLLLKQEDGIVHAQQKIKAMRGNP